MLMGSSIEVLIRRAINGTTSNRPMRKMNNRAMRDGNCVPVEHVRHHLNLGLGGSNLLLRGGLRAAAEQGEGHVGWFVEGGDGRVVWWAARCCGLVAGCAGWSSNGRRRACAVMSSFGPAARKFSRGRPDAQSGRRALFLGRRLSISKHSYAP